MGLIYEEIKSEKAQPKRHKQFLSWKSSIISKLKDDMKT